MKLTKLFTSALLVASLAGCSSSTTTTSTAPSTAASTGDTTTATTGEIHVYTRDASSGTREAFEDAIGLEDGALTATASEVSSNGDMATRVGQDAAGIGYTSLTTDFEANNVKPLTFEGVEATTETVLDGSYQMQRPFNFVTRAEGDYESDDLEQLVEAFIAYITESTEGKSVIESAGGIVDYTDAKPWEEIAANYPVLNQDNSGLTIRTGGSTSVENCIRAALEAFQPLAGNVQFAMNQTGSGDACPRTLGDEKDGPNAIDIGFASRAFKDDEDVSGAIESGTFCLDAVVVVVNSANTLTDVDAETMVGIYSGAITSYDEVQ